MLVFDGFMIRKTKEITDDLIGELNDHVYNITGYEVQFIIKPLNEGHDIPADELNSINNKKGTDNNETSNNETSGNDTSSEGGETIQVKQPVEQVKKQKKITFSSLNYHEDIDKLNMATVELLINTCFSKIRFDEPYFSIISNVIKYHFGENGFPLFKLFAIKGKKNENDTILSKQYDAIVKNGTNTIIKLFYYAFEDNKIQFHHIITKNSVFSNFDTSSTVLCRYIRALNAPSFLWKDDNLYCYNGKIWVNNDILLRRYIGNDFCDSILWIYTTVFF